MVISKQAKRARHYQGKQMEIGDIYILYMVCARLFSSADPVVRNVGGVTSHPTF